jgi:hypothetical protein
LAVISRVLPSGAERDTASVPIMPLAPGRFSTTTVMPWVLPMCSAIKRAAKSVEAPAGTGTTILTVRPFSANPESDAAKINATTASARIISIIEQASPGATTEAATDRCAPQGAS